MTSPFGFTFAVIGDPHKTKSAPLFEAAILRAGQHLVAFDAAHVLSEITNANGDSLLEYSVIDPTALHAADHVWSLNATSLLRGADAVIVETDRFAEFFPVMNAVFDAAGLVQANRPGAIAQASDKWATHQVLETLGLPLARTRHVATVDEAVSVARIAGYPLVIKEPVSAQGRGVRLAYNESELVEAVVELGIDVQALIVQDYLECGASDRRILVVGGNVIAGMARHASEGDFRANLALGGTAEGIVATLEERRIATDAAYAMGLGVVGMDLAVITETLPGREYLQAGDVFVIEANEAPGIKGLLDATGVDASDAIVNLLVERIATRGFDALLDAVG